MPPAETSHIPKTLWYVLAAAVVAALALWYFTRNEPAPSAQTNESQESADALNQEQAGLYTSDAFPTEDLGGEAERSEAAPPPTVFPTTPEDKLKLLESINKK